jgi:hypothetical protein
MLQPQDGVRVRRSLAEIRAAFASEFAPVLSKFEIFELTVDEARDSKEDYVWHPGCYVWWSSEYSAVKVGRSLTNSRKRALEHLTAYDGDKGVIINSLKKGEDSRLLLFNVRHIDDYHWVAAVEIFLERFFCPAIRSERIG